MGKEKMEFSQNQVVIEDEFEGVRKPRLVTHLGNLYPIDEIDANDFDNLDFIQNYLSKSRALVIRNALKVFDCGTAFNNWNLDYLTEKCGNNRVHVRRNTLHDNYKTGKAYFAEEVNFIDYVNDLKENNYKSQNSYLAVQNIKKAFHQINDDIKMPPFVEKLHAGPFIWIARSGNYEYNHMDPDDNMLTVIRGRKLVRLYGSNVYDLYPNELGSKGRTLQSQINCDEPQLEFGDEILNRFKNVDCHYCLLREGDMLYFPAFCWHQVKSPELTISVNAFFGDKGENTFVEKMLNSNQKEAFLYWMFNIIKQNMPFPSFDRILVNLKMSLKSFLIKQWHESPDDDQTNAIYDRIIEFFGLEEKLKELEGLDLQMKGKNPPMLRIRGLLMRPAEED